MKGKQQRRYVVRLSCIGTRLRMRRVVSARTSDAAWRKALNGFFNAHPEILQRGLSVGGGVALAQGS